MKTTLISILSTGGLLATLTSPAALSAPRPPHFVYGPVVHNVYDGVSDDLLTGGLGRSGLQSGRRIA